MTNSELRRILNQISWDTGHHIVSSAAMFPNIFASLDGIEKHILVYPILKLYSLRDDDHQLVVDDENVAKYVVFDALEVDSLDAMKNKWTSRQIKGDDWVEWQFAHRETEPSPNGYDQYKFVVIRCSNSYSEFSIHHFHERVREFVTRKKNIDQLRSNILVGKNANHAVRFLQKNGYRDLADLTKGDIYDIIHMKE